jgi:hypothetical protein
MDDFTVGVPGKPARARHRKWPVIVLAVYVLAFTVFVWCFAVAVVVAAVIHGLGSMFDGLFGGLFSGLAGLYMAMQFFFFLLLFPLLMELLALLSTGQVIPFFMRLAQLLGSF